MFVHKTPFLCKKQKMYFAVKLFRQILINIIPLFLVNFKIKCEFFENLTNSSVTDKLLTNDFLGEKYGTFMQ